MAGLKSALRALPLGATEQPVVVELIGTLNASELVQNLRDAYSAAGPRCGLLTTPLWKSNERESARASGRKKGSAPKGGADAAPAPPSRVVLSRPVILKSASSTSRARVRLGGSSLVICSPGVTLERVDISGVGREGNDAPLEARALLEVTTNADLFMRECDVSFDAPEAPARPDARTHAAPPARPPPRAPQPPAHCAAALVESAGHAVFEKCSFSGSPRSYGVIVRNRRSMVRLDSCRVSANRCSNVIVCDGAVAHIGHSSVLENSVEGFGLVVVDQGTQVFCDGASISGNSRDNVYCSLGGRAVLERCSVQGSRMRSGLRVEGPRSSAVARQSTFGASAEYCVRASWGGWASIATSQLSDGREASEVEQTLVEGVDSACVVDPTHRRPHWRYITTMERPWTRDASFTTIQQASITANA